MLGKPEVSYALRHTDDVTNSLHKYSPIITYYDCDYFYFTEYYGHLKTHFMTSSNKAMYYYNLTSRHAGSIFSTSYLLTYFITPLFTYLSFVDRVLNILIVHNFRFVVRVSVTKLLRIC